MNRKLIALVALVIVLTMAVPFYLSAQAQQKMTKADVEQMMTKLTNWGRWGKDDQLGTLNLITPAKRKQAAALVKEGTSVSLAHNTNSEPELDNPDPFKHVMTMSGANPAGQWGIDTISTLFHGYQHTHMDALCHVFYQGRMYNGFSQQEVTDKGANRLAITNLKQGIFTRGILMDIPALKGVPYLEPGTAIYPADLEAWEKQAGIKVSPGDAVFIYTGRWARRAAKGAWDASQSLAGIHASCGQWLKNRDIAILGSDGSSDVLPSGIEGMTHPIHLLAINAMGIHIFDNCDLEALSQAARQRKRWEFLLSAAPLPITGGTGSPLNPIATF